MRFVCGYVHMEWQFDLYEACGKYHYFLCKCGVVKKHIVCTFNSDSQAIKWFDGMFASDSEDIEQGLVA